MKKSSKRSWMAALSLGLMAFVCSAFAFIVPITKPATALESKNMQLLVASNLSQTTIDNDWSQGELTHVAGAYNSSSNAYVDGVNQQVRAGTCKPFLESATNSNGDTAQLLKLRYFFGNGLRIGNRIVPFSQTIAVSEVAAIEIKIYIDFSNAETYTPNRSGVRLYAPDATGQETEQRYYMIPEGTPQRTWVTLTVDPALLADANGNLTGFQFGSYSRANVAAGETGDPESYMYTSEDSVNGKAYLYIESIKAIAPDNALKSVNVALEDEIAMKFHYSLADKFAESSEAYVNFTVEGEETQVFVSNAEIDANGRYVFEYRLAAAQLTEEITAKFVGGNVEREFTYSFAEYANTLLSMDSSSDELKALLKATLNYGAYAQVYFEENMETLANEGLDESDIAVVKNVSEITESVLTVEGSKPSGVESISYDLTCKSATVMKLYVTLATDVNIDDYIFTFDGEMVDLEMVGANKYVYTVTGIAAAELDKTFTFGLSKDSEVATITVNAYSYFAGRIADSDADEKLVNLVKAMYLYGEAANGYFDMKEE